MMNNQNILVTAIGSFSADIVIETLKKNQYNVVGVDIYPRHWLANGDKVKCFYQVPLAIEENLYIEAIIDICRKEDIDYIFPLTDVEIDIFNKKRNIFKDINVTLCTSSYETINLCRNKRKTSEVLVQVEGVNIIHNYSGEDVKKGEIKFPVICKRIDGRSSQGLYKIFSSDELLLFYQKNDMSSYIIQPYIEGDIITVDIVRNAKSGQCIAVPRKELLRTLNGAGTSVYVYEDAVLEALCIRIAEKLNINGCVNFEFIDSSSEGKYFLECNPRFSGGVKFTCMSGYDCVLNHLRCFQGEKIESKIHITQQYISRKYKEYITLIG